MSNNTTKIIGALLLGAAVGVAIGILLAPDKGSETRKKMADGASDLATDAEEEIKEVKNKDQVINDSDKNLGAVMADKTDVVKECQR